MVPTKQTARNGNQGLPKATKSNGSGSDGNGNVPLGQFRKQLENWPPAAASKRKKPYGRAFWEIRKLQPTLKLIVSKYQMAR